MQESKARGSAPGPRPSAQRAFGATGQWPACGVQGQSPWPYFLGTSAGFALIEVLVAFVIAALALAVLYSGGIEGLVTTRTALRRDEAVARATSRLEALCHGARLTAGVQSGDDGSGFRWRSQVQVAESATVPRGTPDEPHPPLRLVLYNVGVTVSWPGTLRPHEVSLATTCLTVPPSPGPG